jgi:hypothetical protein
MRDDPGPRMGQVNPKLKYQDAAVQLDCVAAVLVRVCSARWVTFILSLRTPTA